MAEAVEPRSAITPTPMPTTLSLIPAASSPIKFPQAAADVDFNVNPTTAIGTSTGTTALTLASASGPIMFGSVVTGTGVPANTTIVGQTSGLAGKNGVYTTNHATTLAGVTLTLTPDLPIDPDGSPQPPIVVNPATAIPGEPLIKTNAGHDYTLVLPTFAWMPLKHDATNIFNLSQVPPFLGKTYPFNPTPPPALTMTRTPPFPAYPT